MGTCPTCGQSLASPPPEPPLGTWVRAVELKPGATARMVAKRFIDSDGNDGWAEPGFYALAKWGPMWEAWGPLEVCGPWGEDL